MVQDSPPARSVQPGLRERKKREVRRGIRDAALRMFVEHGFAAVSVDQIAAAADVSRSTFFNHFASKEAVVFEPDPDELEHWRRLREQRPADEPLWQSLTAVLLGCMDHSRDWLVAQKQVKAASPALARSLQECGNRVNAEVGEWVGRRTRVAPDPMAQLQLNTAMGAVMTAFEEWSPERPFDEFLTTACGYLDRLGRAFSGDQDGARQ